MLFIIVFGLINNVTQCDMWTVYTFHSICIYPWINICFVKPGVRKLKLLLYWLSENNNYAWYHMFELRKGNVLFAKRKLSGWGDAKGCNKFRWNDFFIFRHVTAPLQTLSLNCKSSVAKKMIQNGGFAPTVIYYLLYYYRSGWGKAQNSKMFKIKILFFVITRRGLGVFEVADHEYDIGKAPRCKLVPRVARVKVIFASFSKN